jgi:hypothetical protein
MEARQYQDDLPAVSVSKLRALGVVAADARSVFAVFGEGDAALKREVRIVHRRFPNGGSWSFFICPACERRARVLRLYDGGPMCRWCCLRLGLRYRVEYMPKDERARRRVRDYLRV